MASGITQLASGKWQAQIKVAKGKAFKYIGLAKNKPGAEKLVKQARRKAGTDGKKTIQKATPSNLLRKYQYIMPPAQCSLLEKVEPQIRFSIYPLSFFLLELSKLLHFLIMV